MSKSDILAAMKDVEGQILAWNQNIHESMKYLESRFADFHSISISGNPSCWSVKPHLPPRKLQLFSRTAAATIPSPPHSPPLSLNSPHLMPKNDPAPPKQTPSQPCFEELIKRIEAKMAANVLTPPSQLESSNDTQVATTVTSMTDLPKISREEQQATKSACAPKMCGSSNAYKVFDELIERNSSSPKEEVAAGPLREKSYIFVDEKKTKNLARDSSTNKIRYVRKVLDELIHRVQVNMKEKWANIHSVPAATLTGYFEKKGAETLPVFDSGGSAFDAWVREASNSLFDVFYFSYFEMKWVSTKVHEWRCDSFSSYSLKYLLARLRMNRKIVWCKVVTKSIALGVVGGNICWVVLCFKNVPSVSRELKQRTVCKSMFHVKFIACGSNYTAAICLQKWVSGAEQSQCSACRQAFVFTRKRHNCYNCGLVHCHACSSRKALRAALSPNLSKPYRVCDSCFVKLSKVAEAGVNKRRNSGPRLSGDNKDRLDKVVLRLAKSTMPSNAKSGKHDETVESAFSVQEVTVGDKRDDGLFLDLGMIVEGLIKWRGHFSNIHLEDKVVLKVCGVIQLGIEDTGSRNRWGIHVSLAQGPAPTAQILAVNAQDAFEKKESEIMDGPDNKLKSKEPIVSGPATSRPKCNRKAPEKMKLYVSY